MTDCCSNKTISGNSISPSVIPSINSDLIPALDSTYDIGSNSLRWLNMFADTLNLAGNAVPATNNAHNLGSSLLRWASVFAGAVNANLQSTFSSGLITTTIDSTASSLSLTAAEDNNIALNVSGVGQINLATPNNVAILNGGALEIQKATNQLLLGLTNVLTLSTNLSANRTITFQDPGADANVVTSEGAQTINGLKTFGTGIVLPTSGGTADTFNYFELDTAVSTTFNCGSGSGSSTVDVVYTRIGTRVFCDIPNFTFTSGTSSTGQINATAAIPTRFRPTRDAIVGFIRTVNAGTNAVGFLYITDLGGGRQLQIHRDVTGTAWGTSAVVGVGDYNMSFSWTIA